MGLEATPEDDGRPGCCCWGAAAAPAPGVLGGVVLLLLSGWLRMKEWLKNTSKSTLSLASLLSRPRRRFASSLEMPAGSLKQ